MRQRLITKQESLRAPGLPFPPRGDIRSHGVRGTSYENPRMIEVMSVNYDYLPMNLDSPKMLWVDLRGPAPDDLLVGTPVRLHMTPNYGIQTQLSKNNPLNSMFEVDDIIDSRIVLSPYKGSCWLPTNHSSCDSPFGWGYDTNWTNVRPAMQYQKYGYGVPVTYLEYTPHKYSLRAKRLEATMIEEDYYRSLRNIPGWQ